MRVGNGHGRPSKGPRVRVTTRIPVQSHVQLSKSATKQGVTFSSWVEQAIHDRLETERGA